MFREFMSYAVQFLPRTALLEVLAMSDEKARPWREIAAEMSKEQNPERVLEMCEELTRAMDEQKPGKPSAKVEGA
jgi:hypothetical protein